MEVLVGTRSKRQGSIDPWGPGRWRVRLSYGSEGTRRQRLSKVIHGTKDDAQRYLNAAIRRREKNEAVVLSREALGVWAGEWLKTWCGALAPRTRADYAGILNRYLTPELRARKLSALAAGDLQLFVNDLSASGLSPRTVAMVHGAIRACLSKAVKLGKLPRNVARDVELPRKAHADRVFFTPDEARRFCEAVRGDRWEAFFLLMVHVGLRPGEALGLKWSDLDGGNLRVRRALVRIPGHGAMLEDTKTPRGRRAIPLKEQASEALQRHRRSQIEWRLKLGTAYQDQDLIFASETGGFADCQNIRGRHLKPILKAAKLPLLRLYDLRHCCATMLLVSGEHPKVVQERLGHASITLTLDTYSHVVPGMQERASQRLDELLRPREGAARSSG
jgi:integrase